MTITYNNHPAKHDSYIRSTDGAIKVYFIRDPVNFPVMNNRKINTIITETLPGLDDSDNYVSGNQIYINMGSYDEPTEFEIYPSSFELHPSDFGGLPICDFTYDSDTVTVDMDLTEQISGNLHIGQILEVGDYIYLESAGWTNSVKVKEITSDTITLDKKYGGDTGSGYTHIFKNRLRTVLEYFRDNLMDFVFCPQDGDVEYNVGLVNVKFEQAEGNSQKCNLTIFSLGEIT